MSNFQNYPFHPATNIKQLALVGPLVIFIDTYEHLGSSSFFFHPNFSFFFLLRFCALYCKWCEAQLHLCFLFLKLF